MWNFFSNHIKHDPRTETMACQDLRANLNIILIFVRLIEIKKKSELYFLKIPSTYLHQSTAPN